MLDSFWNEEKEKKKRDSLAREGLCLPLRISVKGGGMFLPRSMRETATAETQTPRQIIPKACKRVFARVTLLFKLFQRRCRRKLVVLLDGLGPNNENGFQDLGYILGVKSTMHYRGSTIQDRMHLLIDNSKIVDTRI
jgi:hypothetical protein